MEKVYDLIIVGGGITGSAIFYALSKYTNVKDVLLLEKYSDLSTLNSGPASNSQTLHFGDVETNYTYEKSKSVKKAAEYILNYTKTIENSNKKIIQKCQKMVLGVGEEEIETLDSIYNSNIKELFPGLQNISKKELSRIEPNIVLGRDKKEKVAALLSNCGYMVNFSELSKSFISKSKMDKNKKIKFNTKVYRIIRDNAENYIIIANNGVYKARFVVFCAGIYSLYFAKMLGYDKNISILPVGGGYYYSKRMLNGKVYRVQHGHIPFAAVHADPDITNSKITRYGPTVILGPEIEKGHISTMLDDFKVFDLDLDSLKSLKNIFMDKDINRIIRNNASYTIPIIGKMRFLKNEVQKIIPKMKYSDLWTVNASGGIRPQIIDEKKKSLILGEAKLKEENLIFNITPSPGASSCLGSALEDISYISNNLGLEFRSDLWEMQLGKM